MEKRLKITLGCWSGLLFAPADDLQAAVTDSPKRSSSPPPRYFCLSSVLFPSSSTLYLFFFRSFSSHICLDSLDFQISTLGLYCPSHWIHSSLRSSHTIQSSTRPSLIVASYRSDRSRCGSPVAQPCHFRLATHGRVGVPNLPAGGSAIVPDLAIPANRPRIHARALSTSPPIRGMKIFTTAPG